MTNFSSLSLLPSILKELDAKGYLAPTPIQSQCIPHLLAGRDLLGIAQTGTGKTAAFSLPILHRFSTNKVILKEKQARAIILTPTRELATQIDANIKRYGAGLNLKSVVVIGGLRRDYQVEALASGADIVIGTPGRVMDLMRSEELLFDQLEVFILDEADMMLDMGFLADVEYVSSKLPKARNTILFSATMPKIIEDLAKKILINPVKVEVTPESSTLDKVEQKVLFVDDDEKLLLLHSILKDESISRVMVFCKAKYGVAIVVEALENANVSVGEIHSNKTQREREKALSDFSSGSIRVLVATDIASRGIDITHVSHVINYNMPEDATNYVHRIGRTARAGKEGVALSFCGEKDLPLLRNVEKLIEKKIMRIVDHPYHKEFLIKPKRNKKWRGKRNRK
ncbi:MAG: DEAD/DEAH box helicase [Bacteriovoracaceae bacterium]|nr:DEAD/DEAH box helicase [Bacteriovoracaceae bacterium]